MGFTEPVIGPRRFGPDPLVQPIAGLEADDPGDTRPCDGTVMCDTGGVFARLLIHANQFLIGVSIRANG